MSNKQINVDINFRANAQGLEQIRSQMQSFQNMKIADLRFFNKDATLQDLQSIKAAANEVEQAFQASFNPKLNTTSLATFQQHLKSTGMSLKTIEADFSKAGIKGQNALEMLLRRF